MNAKANQHKNKKPDYSNAKVSSETCKLIKDAIPMVRSDIEKDGKGNFICLYPNEDISSDFTKILMIQQAVSGSLREGQSLLAKTKIPKS